MDYKKVIAESWEYTQNNKRLVFWFGIFPSFFTTTFSVGYIAYQFFAFKKSYLFDDADESFLHEVFAFIWEFITTHVSWMLPLVIVAIICSIIYLLYPTLAKASAIQVIARNRNGQKTSVGTGIRHGIMSFLPLFEYHLIIKSFSMFSILIEVAFVLRNLGPTIFGMLMPVFILAMIVSLILTLLFTYTDFFIVIDGYNIFESMKRSARLVIVHWKDTFLVTILMIIIGLRIVIQVILIFLIPTLIILVTGYLATVALPITGIIVGSIIGVIGLVLAAYINGVVDVFSYTVWTFTFLDLSAEKETSARGTAEEATAE